MNKNLILGMKSRARVCVCDFCSFLSSMSKGGEKIPINHLRGGVAVLKKREPSMSQRAKKIQLFKGGETMRDGRQGQYNCRTIGVDTIAQTHTWRHERAHTHATRTQWTAPHDTKEKQKQRV